MDNELFLSEPTTSDDAKVASGDRDDTPDGLYNMVVRGLIFKTSSKGSPYLQVRFGHTGPNAKKYKGSSLSIFPSKKGENDRFASLAIACGFTQTEVEAGLRWGQTEEQDNWGNSLACVVNADNEVVTESFVGKTLQANIKTNDKGFQGINYVKPVEEIPEGPTEDIPL